MRIGLVPDIQTIPLQSSFIQLEDIFLFVVTQTEVKLQGEEGVNFLPYLVQMCGKALR